MSETTKPKLRAIESFLKKRREEAEQNKKTYVIEVVTPMFGGGVETGEVDETMPVRATEIRGHLRYWWRLLYGADYPDIKKLFDAESRLWGNTKTPSKVDTNVIQNPPDKKGNKNYWRENAGSGYGFEKFGPELYALFPATQGETPCLQLLREGYKFKLELIFSSLLTDREKLEIENAVLTWIRFGGVGARTRRGCGALHLIATEPSSENNIDNTFLTSIDIYLFDSDEMTPLTAEMTPLTAWNKALEIYRDYRQSFRGNKRKKKLRSGNVILVPGRSKWPEPDAIRAITGCALSGHLGHSKPVVSDIFLNAFPRAVLGLPINFHFSDGPRKKAPAKHYLDPADAELFPNISAVKKDKPPLDRMASPIITKPILIKGKWYPMIAILPYEHALTMNARLTFQSSRGKKEEKTIEKQHISGQRFLKNELVPMSGHSNAIKGLIAHLTKNSFVELDIILKQQEVKNA
ncbi:MAG: type III-B CRISPR module RAMP protein Cmr1 [Cystobacterineae bacterium]|nr:type III-B CRISPR module RAMP protein Cmr1 [Cystobacterineae bacterium]